MTVARSSGTISVSFPTGMILRDDRLYPDLVSGDAVASFFALMKAVADRWNDRIKAEVLYAEPGGRVVGSSS